MRTTVKADATRIADPAEKKKQREELAATFLPTWGESVERQLRDDGPFLSGAKISVADVSSTSWSAGSRAAPSITCPPIFSAYPKLSSALPRDRSTAAIKAWYART